MVVNTAVAYSEVHHFVYVFQRSVVAVHVRRSETEGLTLLSY